MIDFPPGDSREGLEPPGLPPASSTPPPTFPPTPPPLPYRTPEPRRPSALGAGLAWALIVVSVLTVLGAHWYADRYAGAGERKERLTADLQFRIAARYVLGARAAYELAGHPPDANAMGQLTDGLRQAAKTPEDRLRAAAVWAELDGPGRAVRAIDEAEESITDPDLREDAELFRDIYTHGTTGVSLSEQARLVSRHGYFARLALTSDLPKADPRRRSVLMAAVRTTITLVAVSVGGTLTLVAGIVLLAIAFVRVSTKKLRPRMRPPAARTSALLEGFAIYLGGIVLVSLGLSYWLRGSLLAGVWVMAGAVLVAVVWPRLRGMSGAELREALGWHRGRGFVVEFFCGWVGWIAGLPLLAAAAALSALLAYKFGGNGTHPIVQEVGGGLWRTVGLYLLACVWAPITEELMFRGAFYAHMRQRFTWVPSALIVGVIFAVIHPQGWVGVPPITALAFTFASIREWRGSLIASMSAHALNNFLVTTMLIMAVG